MGHTHIQARVPDDLAEKLDDYQEEHLYTNRSETIRAIIRDALEDSDGAESDLTGDDGIPVTEEEDFRMEALAEIGEKAGLAGIITACFALLVPTLSILAIEYFSLTVGSFGLYFIVGMTFFLGLFSMGAGVIGIIATGLAFAQRGIHVGRIGDLLSRHVPPEVVS